MNDAFDNKKRHQKNGAKGAVTTTTERRPNSQKGKKNKKGKKRPVPRIKRGTPTYQYVCDCHDEHAAKEPCERKVEDRAEGKFSESALGKWHCSISKKRCKVRRRKVESLPVVEIANGEVAVTGELPVAV